MERELANAVAEAIGAATGTAFTVRAQDSVGGGCINVAWRLDGAARSYFVKLNSPAREDMFAAEFAGLEALRAAAGFDPARGAFAPWFLRIVRNAAFNATRARKRRVDGRGGAFRAALKAAQAAIAQPHHAQHVGELRQRVGDDRRRFIERVARGDKVAQRFRQCFG